MEYRDPNVLRVRHSNSIFNLSHPRLVYEYVPCPMRVGAADSLVVSVVLLPNLSRAIHRISLLWTYVREVD